MAEPRSAIARLRHATYGFAETNKANNDWGLPLAMAGFVLRGMWTPQQSFFALFALLVVVVVHFVG